MGKRSDKWKATAKQKEPNLIPVMNLIAILIPALLTQREYIKLAGLAVNTPVQAPKKQTTEKPPEDEEKKLNLTLSQTSLGFYLHAGGEMLPGGDATEEGQRVSIGKIDTEVWLGRDAETGEEVELMRVYEYNDKKYIEATTIIKDDELAARRESFEKKYAGTLTTRQVKDFNYAALNERLLKIKEKFPKEENVFFNPEPNIPFSQIVYAMDASRERIEKKELTPDERANLAPDKKAAKEADLAIENSLFPKVIFGVIGVGG